MDHDVFVNVDGARVKIGTAVQTADGFTLHIGGLAIQQAAPRATGGPVFPPYGRSKGQPVAGASAGDLEYYAAGCQRTLDDPAKARWHEKERALMDAIKAEQAKHTAPIDDDKIPF